MRTTLSLALLFLSLFLHAQKKLDFVDGFIITNDSDIEFLSIAFRSSEENYQSCLVKKGNDELLEYLPGQIQGFGYEGGRSYNLVESKNLFAEVLVKGKMSLWKLHDEFFIIDNTTLYQVSQDNQPLRKSLAKCMSESAIDKRLIEKERLLKELVIDYNVCKNQKHQVYSQRRAKMELGFGLLSGINNSTLDFSNSNVDYLNQVSSSDPFFGVAISISFPRALNQLSFQQELIFSSSYYYSDLQIEDEGSTFFYETSLEFTSVSLPFSFKYTTEPIIGGISTSFQMGLTPRIIQKSETNVITEILEGNVVSAEPIREAYEVKKNQTGLWFGLGLSRDFGSLRSELFARSTSYATISESEELGGKDNFYSIGISLAYLITKRK